MWGTMTAQTVRWKLRSPQNKYLICVYLPQTKNFIWFVVMRNSRPCLATSNQSRFVVHSMELSVCEHPCPFSSGLQGFRVRSLPSCSLFKEHKANPFYSSFILKLNVYEICICSSEHLSNNSGCNDPSERVEGLLGPQSPLQTACPGDGENQWASMGSSLQGWIHVPWTTSIFGQHCSPPWKSPGYQPYPVAFSPSFTI